MDLALILTRALHFAASMIAFGIIVFQCTLAPEPLRAHLAKALRLGMRTASLIAALTSLLWLLLLSATMGDGWVSSVDPQVVSAVLFGTQFGSVWLWHMLLSVALIGVGLSDGRMPQRLGSPMALVVSATQLASLGLVGHAVMLAGAAGLANRATQILHLLAGGYWLGSLVPVILCLRFPTDHLRGPSLVALRRFSNVGHVAVASVILSGIVNARLITGRWFPDPAVPYQGLLALKIAVVALMTALAIVNRYGLVPRLRTNAAALDQIRRVSILVFALGLGAVALVSVFGTMAPN